MIPTRVQVRKSQADDLAEVCLLGAEKLVAVAHAVRDAPRTINQDRLKATIKEAVAPASADGLCRVVFGLSTAANRDAHSIGDLVDGLTAALLKDFASDNRLANWEEVKGPLTDILKAESVYLSAKALEVSYDFERILTSCRILTSVRPVYNDPRDEIVGSTLVHTLRLDFVAAGGESRSIGMSVDLSDIRNILKVCNNAIQKAAVARKDISEKWKMEVISPGGEGEEQ